MTGRPRGRYALVAVLSTCAAAVGAVMCSAAIGSPRPGVPSQDSFTGHITSATGKFTGDRGNVTILLQTDHSCEACGAPSKRQLTVVLDGRRCRSWARRCIRLTGTLSGKLVARPSRVSPDVGVPFTLAAHGLIGPIGHVSATGSVQGTGFVPYGYEPLQLTLTAPGGRVAIAAKSGLVPGFTSP